MEVSSPYEGRRFSTWQHVKISAYWFATNFLWGAMLLIMLPSEVRHLAPHHRITALALLTGLAAIVALTVPLVVGALSDRCASKFGRRRPFMVVGVLVNLVGLAAMYAAFKFGTPIERSPGSSPVLLLLTSPGFMFFLLAYIIVQFGNNIASAAYSGVIPDLVPHEQRGTASGYMALMSQAGTLFGVVLVGMFLHHQSEYVKYVLIGAALSGVALITITGIRETPLPIKPPKIDWSVYVKSLWISPKQYPDFAWVWITRALVMLGFYSVLPFLNYYLMDVIGIANPDDAASKLSGIVLLASSVSGIYGGYLSDKVGRKRVVYVANVMIAAMSLSFIFCRTLGQVLMCGTMFGLGFGAYTSVDWALGTDVLPTKSNAAKEMGVWHIAMTLPQSIAAPFAGYLIAVFGFHELRGADGQMVTHYTITGYSAVFVLCAICFALGAYLLRNVRSVN